MAPLTFWNRLVVGYKFESPLGLPVSSELASAISSSIENVCQTCLEQNKRGKVFGNVYYLAKSVRIWCAYFLMWDDASTRST